MGTKPKLHNAESELLLTQILNTLNLLNGKLDEIVEVNTKILEINEALLQKVVRENSEKSKLNFEPDVMALLSLPMALRKTVMVLYRLEQATADDLAKQTKRLRAVESAAANELVRMGYIKKKREGREVYFYIESSEENKN